MTRGRIPGIRDAGYGIVPVGVLAECRGSREGAAPLKVVWGEVWAEVRLDARVAGLRCPAAPDA
ncbi:hypothetical protein ACFVX6_08075 [Streptomyces sp. NPDC058289]|uniref:hypothetical protein n=1 Tax=Streptomyces sp. NPDC058289 TaxID=3346425 RepID=UPI0036EA019D